METRIDIKSEREFFREVFEKILKGEYAIPIFQRDFEWKPKQVIEFFDSIWRGYPIGSILLWQPDTNMLIKDILTDEVRSAQKPSYFVLDGRQRLSTFYGCVSRKADKRKEFHLYFNLETETFTHVRSDAPNYMKVSDIYDTFALLDKMNDVSSRVSDQQKARQYIERAKRLNAILQGYTVSEVYINNCSLRQAEVVFSRINSKGTGIGKTDMLQAMSYREGEMLLSERIKEIQLAIAPFGFKSLSKENLLKCFYRYAGKDFYDAKPEDLEHMDFGGQTPQIKDCLERSVKFLHNECHVMDVRLLPYNNQLVAMTWFFKEHQQANDRQIMALKRWFYYTTYNQVLMNSSMKNVRRLFRRFESFVFGHEQEAYDYEPIKMDSNYHFKFSLRNARTDFLAMACINDRLVKGVQDVRFNGICNIQPGDIPYYGFVCFDDNDKNYFENLLSSNIFFTENGLSGYALTPMIISAYQSGAMDKFESDREVEFLRIEQQLLTSVGLDIRQR